MSAFDFEKQSLESILNASELGLKYKVNGPNVIIGKDGEEQLEQYLVEWPLEDKERLIEAVADFNGDWDEISKITFDSEYSPEECAL